MTANVTHQLVAGLDEAGRGPLAGPVVAAAVILDRNHLISGINDSKKLTASKRQTLFSEIHTHAIAVGVGLSHREEIDRLNILQATHLAMQRALDDLPTVPDHIQIDGQHITLKHPSQETIVGGDGKIEAIGAASIIAKVTRDAMMVEYHKIFPEYAFDKHKGYGTEAHLISLQKFGASPIHRQSFKPVREHLPSWNRYRDNQAVGNLGEQLAASRLVGLGYSLEALQYRVVHMGEIDIIARDGEVTVFVEVKSQTPGSWGEGEARVDARKRDRIMATAQHYCIEKGIDSEVRFDVISVTFTKAGPQIRHTLSGIDAQ